MRLAPILFVILLLLLGCVAALFVATEPSNSSGSPHPTMVDMAVGGDGVVRHGSLFWLGLIFSLLQASLFFGLILLSLRRRGEIPFSWSLVVGFLAYLAVFAALHISYRSWVGQGSSDLVFGFPPPTAWMLFGLWPIPALFIAIYVLTFDRLIMSPEENAAFIERVKASRN